MLFRQRVSYEGKKKLWLWKLWFRNKKDAPSFYSQRKFVMQLIFGDRGPFVHHLLEIFCSNLNNWHQLNIFKYWMTTLQWKRSKQNISSVVCWAIYQSFQSLTMEAFFFWHFYPGSFDSVNGRLPRVLFSFFVRGIAQAHSNIHLRCILWAFLVFQGNEGNTLPCLSSWQNQTACPWLAASPLTIFINSEQRASTLSVGGSL